MRKAVALLLLGLGVIAGATAYGVETWRLRILEPDRRFELPVKGRLRALQWSPAWNRLLALDDNGAVLEIDVRGFVRSIKSGNEKARGLHLDESGRLFILAVDGSVLSVEDPPHIETTTQRKGGVPEASRDSVGVPLEIVVPDPSGNGGWSTSTLDSSIGPLHRITGASTIDALVPQPGSQSLLLVSSARGLMVASREGEALTPWRRVAAPMIDGAALVPGVGLVLATPAELLVFSSFGDWEQLLEILRGEP